MRRQYIPLLISLAGGVFLVALLLLGLNRFAPTALAHPVTVDAAGADWTMSAPISTNLGHIARNSAQEGEYIWNDAPGDERTDFSDPAQEDVAEFRLTGDSGNLYFLVRMVGPITTTTGDGAPMVQIAMDLNRDGTGNLYFGGSATTTVSSQAGWEYLATTRFGSGIMNIRVWDKGWNASYVGSASISGTAGIIEGSIPWSALGFSEIPTLPIRFTVAVFRANGSDDIWWPGGTGNGVLDCVTNYGDPGATLNTWNEVSDGVVDYYFDVWFEADGDPYPPLLVSEFIYDPPTTEPNNEWIEIYNASPITIALDNYKVGDEETIGGGEGMYQFPTASIGPGQVVVVANRADAFTTTYGFYPDFELVESVATVPNLTSYGTWATDGLNLGNSGDEIMILDGSDTAVDVATYEGGSWPGVTAHSGPPANSASTLERRPVYQDTNDCSVDFRVQSTPTPGQASPDLQIAKSGPALAMPGDLIIYTIVYSNSGVADAHSVVITDVLPNGVSYVSDTSGLPCPACSSGIGPSGIITWIVGTLTPTDGISFTLIGQIDHLMPFGSIITNTVEIGTPDAEVTTTNNSSQWVTNISPLDLVVYKWGPMYAFSGETIVYNIVLENRGVATATNVILTDTLPLSTTYVSDDSGWTCPSCIPGAGGVIVWTAGDVPSDTLYTFHLTVTVGSDVPSGTVLTNTVEVSTDTPGDNPANNTTRWETTAYPLVSIHDIQYVSDPATNDASPYAGQVVWVEGVVVAGTGEIGSAGNNFVIEHPGGGPWSGLMVYNGGTFPDVVEGDYVRLLGTVQEYNGMTELNIRDAPSAQQVISTGNPLPAPEVITTGLFATAVPTTAEPYESVLIEFQGATVTNENLGYGEWAFDDGSGPTIADDSGKVDGDLTYTPALGHFYKFIRGIGWYSYGNYKLEPRYDADIDLDYPVTFIYHDLEDVVHSGEAVYLAGNFNGWNATATPMSASADFSAFSVTLTLENPNIEYKYIVYTDTVPGGPANWNWLQSTNRTKSLTGTTVLNDYRDIRFGYVVLQWPPAVTTTVGISTENIYGQIWADDLTSRAGPPRAILAEVGYGTDPNPANWTTWEAMTWNTQSGNNDEFMGVLTPTAAGVYSYVVRFNANWGTGNPNNRWEYGDKDGVHPNDPFEIENAGVLTVLAPALSLTKAVTPDTDVELGGVVTYTVTLTNSGEGQAIGVVLTDTLPSAVAFGGWVQQPSGAVYGSGVITWTGDLAGGTSVTLIFTATVGTDPSLYNQTVTNTAYYRSDNAGSGSAEAAFTTERRYYIYLPLVMKNHRP